MDHDAGDLVDMIVAQWRLERPDLDPSPIAVVGRISRASRALDVRLKEVYATFGLGEGDFDLLVTVRRNGPPYRLTPTQLGEQMMVTSGAVTKRVDRLAEVGLVRRVPAEDGRSWPVELTAEGVALTQEAMAAHVANEDRILAALSPAEREQLAALLRTLLISFES
ncbi:MarR family winged helix-turn-helix transcriptional regulator [Pseudactinotalea suaedae]|uniref:MarR family winged helix-turn-helix transcriptional regulator n=1 Tax=Pseudactinotalea suaedae TaxID=1524924 RepID=UPI0012E31804|nr:MarR family transcriptional regulator [Pseudactinotalea suaedae]